MNRMITYENLRQFTYSNDQICKRPIRGIVVTFFGLNATVMYSEDTEEGIYFAERGILYLVPYNNPWAWMNPQAVQYTDELLDVVIDHFKLPESIPIVATGGSMGGLSALAYTCFAKRTPVACVANCPVCDLPYHCTERPDLPRTLYSAFFHEEGEISEVLEKASPFHLAEKMPKVPYHIFHCDADRSVNIERHSNRFVAKMREVGHSVSYDVIPGRGHCDLPPEMVEQFRQYSVKAIEAKK